MAAKNGKQATRSASGPEQKQGKRRGAVKNPEKSSSRKKKVQPRASSSSAFVHKLASVSGNVILGEHASIWPGAVLRGDMNSICIGRSVNIQDNATLHVDYSHSIEIGDYSLIGHNAVLHGCSIGRAALVGIGAIVLDGAEIGDFAMITARCLIRGNMRIPPRALVYEKEGKLFIKEGRADPAQTIIGCLEYMRLALQARGKKTNDFNADELARAARQILLELEAKKTI